MPVAWVNCEPLPTQRLAALIAQPQNSVRLERTEQQVLARVVPVEGIVAVAANIAHAGTGRSVAHSEP
jgi:hypothetical protein